MHYSLIKTPLGTMMAVADANFLHALNFVEKENLEFSLNYLSTKLNTPVSAGKTVILKMIEEELGNYFSGKTLNFNTPIFLTGSEFQKKVWEALQKIPVGQTCSYLDIAKKLKKPTASRAVGGANGSNLLVLVIPCHRVISHDGGIGGYGGGLARKEWLLAHEKKSINRPGSNKD